MDRLTANIEPIADQIRQLFSLKDSAREKVLPLCRETIRYSSQAIRAIHRQEFDEACQSLKTARNLLDEVFQVVAGHC